MSSRSASPRADENVISTKVRYFESLQEWVRRKRKRTYPSPSSSPSPSPSFEPIPSKRTVHSRISRHPNKKYRDNYEQVVAGSDYDGNIGRLLSLALGETMSPQIENGERETPKESADQLLELGPVSVRMQTRPGRCRSSVRLREILPPRDFSPNDLKRPLKLSQPPCRISIGCVSQILPEPGWRVTTRPRSREFCFTSPLPLYSAHLHSPLYAGKPFTIYFEGEILPGNSEDTVCLAVGFVAGKDRVLRMPGYERGSIGIQCRDGRLYVGNSLLKNAGTAAFEPGDQLGVGMTFSKSTTAIQNPQFGSTPPPSLDVGLFVTRDGSLIGTWNLREFVGQSDALEGFEGGHDLYAAVGTSREVHVDILFEKKDWQFTPPATVDWR